MLKKCYEFIDDNIRRNEIFQCVCAITFFMVVFVLMMSRVVDSTPATKNDYAPLLKQNSSISQDFNVVYTYDNYSISPKENNIVIRLSNTECEISCVYDKDFKFVSYEEIDLAESKIEAIFISIFGACCLAYLGTVLIAVFLPFILYYLLVFIEWLCLLLVGKR